MIQDLLLSLIIPAVNNIIEAEIATQSSEPYGKFVIWEIVALVEEGYRAGPSGKTPLATGLAIMSGQVVLPRLVLPISAKLTVLNPCRFTSS